MITCSHCGQIAADGSAFCPNCGAALPAPYFQQPQQPVQQACLSAAANAALSGLSHTLRTARHQWKSRCIPGHGNLLPVGVAAVSDK